MESIDYIINEFFSKSKTLINLYFITICLYNILYILIKENYKNKIINIYNNKIKNKNSHTNNIDMSNSNTNPNSNSDNNDYEDFIKKVDIIKKSSNINSDNENFNREEEIKELNEKNNISEDKDIFLKNKKKIKKMPEKVVDPEIQMENLDHLFREKIMGNLSSEEEKIVTYKDDLQRISKNFERQVIENSLRGFNIDKQLFLIDLTKLIENIKVFNMENYVCEVLYKMYNKWYIINKKDNKLIPENSKFLQKFLKIFSKNDKFRKKINNIQFRCLKKNYLQYKTSQDIELIIITKFIIKNDIDKNKKIEKKNK